MGMEVSTTEFGPGQPIPRRFTCDGENVSLPLRWTGAPERTQGFALIFDDPDAPSGTWDHWVLYDIPAATTSLATGVPSTPTLANGAKHGKNGWGQPGYRGPCPPRGTHRYVIHLFALGGPTGLPPGATSAQLRRAVEGKTIATAELFGTYERR